MMMAMHDDPFHPRHYRDVRRPPGEASTLPGWCYSAQAFLQRERERIFSRAWQFAGRLEEVPQGGYRAVETAGGPVLLVRDGSLGAFANTCRHRGARLVSGCGVSSSLVCPLHGWRYRLDGSLKSAPGIAGDHGRFSLPGIRATVWAGFVFVCFSHRTDDLLSWLGDLPRRLASHRFEDFRVVRRRHYTVRANWKLIAENAMEAYHTGTVHGDSLGAQASRDLVTKGHWDAIQVLGEASVAVLPGEPAPFPPVPSLSPEAQAGTFFTTLHPNTQFACAQDSMWWLHYRPLSPALTHLEVGQCFPHATTRRDDFAEGSKAYFHRWDTGIDEDNAICEAQQAGIASPFHRPGRLSVREQAVHCLNNWIVDQTVDDGHATRRIDAPG